MAEIVKTKKNIGEQIADLLKRQPQNYDVVFSVGLDKIQVKGVKIILKAASPVFEREFVEKWESAVMKEGEGIPMPDIDPSVFELFVNLIISDTWGVNYLKSLNLAPNTLLSLLGLCRKYEISNAFENLEVAALEFIQSFGNYKDTHDFLEMSRENLETVFASEKIPLEEIEIFECACRWAEHQCQQKNIETTGENFRKVLGGCLFEIRFPTMDLKDFTAVSRFKKNIFSAEEKVEIYDFIGSSEAERTEYNIDEDSDKSLLSCKTNLRVKRGSCLDGSVLRLPKKFIVTKNHPLVCNGVKLTNSFQVNKTVSLHGIGFLGPVDEDSRFDVTVKIRRYVEFCFRVTNEIEMSRKNIFARKGEIFHFLFDKPIIFEPNCDPSWGNMCCIDYTLKGPTAVSQYRMENPTTEKVEMAGVEFTLGCSWKQGKPLAELLYNLH